MVEREVISMWSALVFAAGAFFVWRMMKEADDERNASKVSREERRDRGPEGASEGLGN